MMNEKDGLITRAERFGTHTTSKGGALLVTLMSEHDQVASTVGADHLRRAATTSYSAISSRSGANR